MTWWTTMKTKWRTEWARFMFDSVVQLFLYLMAYVVAISIIVVILSMHGCGGDNTTTTNNTTPPANNTNTIDNLTPRYDAK